MLPSYHSTAGPRHRSQTADYDAKTQEHRPKECRDQHQAFVQVDGRLKLRATSNCGNRGEGVRNPANTRERYHPPEPGRQQYQASREQCDPSGKLG